MLNPFVAVQQHHKHSRIRMYCHGTIGDVQHVADHFHIAVSMGAETAGRFTILSLMTGDGRN
jgi:hypothetical protein